MSTITTIRRNKKDSGFTTDVSCIRLELQNGTILRYTDSMEDLTTTIKNQNGVEVPIPEVTYSSLMGYDISSIGSDANSSGAVDLEGVLGPLGYTKEQISQGLFDNTRLYLFITDQERPVEDEEKMFTGFWGETTMVDGRYVSKFTSLLSILEVDTGRLISQFCDTTLGSTRCGVRMQAGTRVGGNSDVFSPLTSLSVPPKRWIDFTDDNTITLSGSDIQQIQDKANSGYEFRQLSSNKPSISAINSIQACLFDSGEYLSYTTSGGTSSMFLDDATSLDIFIVTHNPSSSTPIAYIWDSSSIVPLGPIAASASTFNYFSDKNSNADYLRVYDDDLLKLSTRDVFYNYTLNPCVFMANRFSDDYSEILGARVESGYNVTGYIIGEVLVYPQLKNIDRRKVIKYLTDKWALVVDQKIIEGQDDNDARTRRLIAVSGIDFVWFEAFNNGDLGAVEPTWDTTLGNTTVDGDINWLAVPARTLTLTTQSGYGTTGTFVANETLPSDFVDRYEQASFEVITGPNIGTKGIILNNTTTTFTLNSPTLKEFGSGDQIKIQIACFKTADECSERYHNFKNFQGFHGMPTTNQIFKRGKKQ